MNLQKNIGSVKRIAKVILFLNCLNSFANQDSGQNNVPMKNNPARSVSNSAEKLEVNTKANVSSLMEKFTSSNECSDIRDTFFPNNAQYPQDFLNKTNTLAGITVDKTCLETLLTGHWLNDQVINRFFALLQKARLMSMRLLMFDIFFAYRLLTGNPGWAIIIGLIM